MKQLTPVLILLFTLFHGCKKKTETPKEPEPDPTPTQQELPGKLEIELSNKVAGEALVFNKYYLTAKGDSFKVSKFNYFISNVVLTREDNSTYSVPESYYIIRHPDKRIITLNNLPSGSYKSISLLLGVDSVRNTSGAQTGGLDLSTAGDMYWSWTSGYIFLKLEGFSPKSGAGSKSLTYHIGGFGGENKTQRVFQLNFGAVRANVAEGKLPRVVLKADLQEFFRSPNDIDLKTQYYQMSPGPNAKIFADNYGDMISFESLQN